MNYSWSNSMTHNYSPIALLQKISLLLCFSTKNAAISYLPNYNTKILNSNVMKTVVQYINSIDKANKIHEKLGEYWGVHIVGSCAWDPWVGRDQFTKS